MKRTDHTDTIKARKSGEVVEAATELLVTNNTISIKHSSSSWLIHTGEYYRGLWNRLKPLPSDNAH